MRSLFKAITCSVFLSIVSAYIWPQSSDVAATTLTEKDVKVIEFEDMRYPFVVNGEPVHVGGIVVVALKLDEGGHVREASAITGDSSLVQSTLDNVRKWRFEPNSSRSAIIVYHFKIADGLCKSPSSFFTLEGPNLATITACFPSTESGSIARGSVNQPDILDFEEMQYPALAAQASVHGLVVLQVKIDENGAVTDAAAVMGNKILVPACLVNVKKWRFRKTAGQTVVVVYHFTFAGEGLRYNSDQQRQFVLEPGNFVRVIATRMLAQP